jgi:hypothetical protein
VLQLEQQLEQAQAQVHVLPKQLDARDRLREALASKVTSLVNESDESIHLQRWTSLLDEHAGDIAGDLEGDQAPGDPSAELAGLVHNALQELQRWEQQCSTHFGEVYQASNDACSEMAVMLQDLASALLSHSYPTDLLIRPTVANFRTALDREAEARGNARNLLHSWPEQSVLVALRAIRASVDVAFTRSRSMATMQDRLRGMLPALQARRPDTEHIKTFDVRVKKLKHNSEALALKVRHCNEDGEVEEAKQADAELQHTRVELLRVVKERHQHLTSALGLVDQFPELLLPESTYFCQSLKQMLESHGLEIGFQSISLFTDRQVIASQGTRHTVYKARLDIDGDWSCIRPTCRECEW